MKKVLLFAAVLVGAAGCKTEGGGGGGGAVVVPEPTPDPGVAYLSPTDRLVRASMSLRGVRPSIEELERVTGDPDALEEIVDGYLRSPEFLVTMRDLHAHDLLVRNDRLVLPPVFELDGIEGARINASLTEEPLKLVEHVIANDRPYTEIVTADYTLADGIVAGVWGIPYDGDGAEWRVTQFTDGRPHAGILSSTGLFVRHISNGSNYHRGRANLVSSTLLCHDFLESDVVIDGSVDLADPDEVATAVVSNPACAGCHQTLDPLASFFWGWERQLPMARIRTDAQNGVDVYPITYYRADREDLWESRTGRAPAFFGIPGADLADLGTMIAADPRFSLCAAKRFYAYFAQVDRDEVPLEVAAWLQQRFVASGYDARTLAKDVVLSEPFNASHALDAAKAEVVGGLLKTRPEQMARMIADLTGYEWRTDVSINVAGAPYGLVDIPTSDLLGLRTLAGGIDSQFVTSPSYTWNSTASLFLRTFAANAAGHVVEADFDRLLDSVSPTETAEAAIRAQLVRLHLRLYGEVVAADSAEVGESWALFSSALAASGDPKRAWKTTLAGMLADTRIAFY